MSRLTTSILAASLALSGAFAPAALQARTAAPWFTVELAAPATAASVIAGGVLFNCEGTTCTAPRSSDRPLRVCSELRRAQGQIASFTANGEALPADRLARCNG